MLQFKSRNLHLHNFLEIPGLAAVDQLLVVERGQAANLLPAQPRYVTTITHLEILLVTAFGHDNGRETGQRTCSGDEWLQQA